MTTLLVAAFVWYLGLYVLMPNALHLVFELVGVDWPFERKPTHFDRLGEKLNGWWGVLVGAAMIACGFLLWPMTSLGLGCYYAVCFFAAYLLYRARVGRRR